MSYYTVVLLTSVVPMPVVMMSTLSDCFNVLCVVIVCDVVVDACVTMHMYVLKTRVIKRYSSYVVCNVFGVDHVKSFAVILG